MSKTDLLPSQKSGYMSYPDFTGSPNGVNQLLKERSIPSGLAYESEYAQPLEFLKNSKLDCNFENATCRKGFD